MTQRKVVLTHTRPTYSGPDRSRSNPRSGSSGIEDDVASSIAACSAERSEAASTTFQFQHTKPRKTVGVEVDSNALDLVFNNTPVRGGVSGGAHACEASRPLRSTFNKLEHATKQNDMQRVSELLADLPLADQRVLLDQLALNSQLTASARGNRDLDMWSEGIRGALEDAIGVAGGEAYGLMLCKRTLGATACWRPIEAFMRSSGLLDLDVVERQAVYNLLAELVVDAAGFSAKRSGAPLSLKLAAQHSGQVNGIFERAFPGYLAAGLAPVVARQSIRQ